MTDSPESILKLLDEIEEEEVYAGRAQNSVVLQQKVFAWLCAQLRTALQERNDLAAKRDLAVAGLEEIRNLFAGKRGSMERLCALADGASA